MSNADALLRRAFVAVVPPDEVVDAISSLVPRESSRLMQWTNPTRWHVSIDFLGRISNVDIFTQDLTARLAELDPFTIRLRGAGAFTDARRAEVFWLGVEDAECGLRAAHLLVLETARDYGLRIAPQIFRPHLTLARLSRKADLRPDIAALERVAIGEPWLVEGLSFLEAPKPGGGRGRDPYRHVSTLRLKS